MFNTHKLNHRFCQNCGTEPFTYEAIPDGSAVCAVNLRGVLSIDLDALEFQHYDGVKA